MNADKINLSTLKHYISVRNQYITFLENIIKEEVTHNHPEEHFSSNKYEDCPFCCFEAGRMTFEERE